MQMIGIRILTAGLLLSVPAMAAVHSHHHTASHAMVRHSLSARRAHARTEHVLSPGISSERATEIQTALIQHGSLSEEATGNWDAPTREAMQKLQSDNGWQTKLVPDSRALIKLGLGPNSIPEANQAATVPAGPSFN